MELTKKDRILLINQYTILKIIDSQNTSHYERLIAILENGFEIFYGDVDTSMCDDMPSTEGKLVLEILSVYREIENYKRENPDDIDIINHHNSTFQGFDGNNETKYLAFTRFLIENEGKFSEQMKYKNSTDSFNSHFPNLNKYEKMVAKWHEFKGQNSYPRAKNQIIQILEA